jgi:multiple sugar transport system ATP-binding protein
VTADPPATRDVAFVFQQYSLYPHLTVYENLAFPLRSPARRVAEDEIRRRIRQIAGLLRIEPKLESKVTRLSGGEMQRVALGRALVREPVIYLMDEPLSSLDAKLRSELRLELKRIQEEFGATILYVTHDQIEAMTLATRIGIISDGRLIQVGTPRQIYERPRNIHVAGRLGAPSINLLPVDLLPAPEAPTATRIVGARTEHLRIGKANDAMPTAIVRRVEHLGDQNHIHLDLNGHALVTLADPHAPVNADDRVAIELIQPIYFDAAGERLEAGR